MTVLESSIVEEKKMSEQVNEALSPECEYWKRIGWYAAKYGVPIESTDMQLLDFVRKWRAVERQLPEGASWFEIYCAELRQEMGPEEPEFFELMIKHFESDFEYHPRRALELAYKAARVFQNPLGG